MNQKQFLKLFNENVIASSIPADRDCTFDRIELHADSAAPRTAVCIFGAGVGALPSFGGATVVFACPDGVFAPQREPPCSYAAVSLSLEECYSHLSIALRRSQCEHRIADILLLARASRYSVDQLTRALSELLNTGIFILDSEGRMLTGSFSGFSGSRYVQELVSDGALSPESLMRLRGGEDGGEDGVLLSPGDRHRGYDILISSRDRTFPATQALLDGIAGYISQLSTSSESGTMPFLLSNETLNRILLGRLTDASAINDFLTGPGGTAYHRIIILSFSGQQRLTLRQEDAVRLLRRAFRSVIPTWLDGCICAVVGCNTSPQSRLIKTRSDWDGRSFAPGWDEDAFCAELRRLDAHACMCPPFISASNFPPLYTIMRRVMDIAAHIEGPGLDRLIDHETYNPYIITRMSVDSFLQSYTPDQLKMLMYPDAVTLLRYDLVNSTNLSMVLYTYMNCGDVGRTAQKLYMHKNTVYNKLRQIEHILDLRIDDIGPRDCYMMALRIYFYCEKYLGLDMKSVLLK